MNEAALYTFAPFLFLVLVSIFTSMQVFVKNDASSKFVVVAFADTLTLTFGGVLALAGGVVGTERVAILYDVPIAPLEVLFMGGIARLCVMAGVFRKKTLDTNLIPMFTDDVREMSCPSTDRIRSRSSASSSAKTAAPAAARQRRLRRRRRNHVVPVPGVCLFIQRGCKRIQEKDESRISWNQTSMICGINRDVSLVIKELSSRIPMPAAQSPITQLPINA